MLDEIVIYFKWRNDGWMWNKKIYCKKKVAYKIGQKASHILKKYNWPKPPEIELLTPYTYSNGKWLHHVIT